MQTYFTLKYLSELLELKPQQKINTSIRKNDLNLKEFPDCLQRGFPY